MGSHANTKNSNGRDKRRTALAVGCALFGLAVAGTGVYAGLNAVATGSEAIASGTLNLTVAAGSGSTGFTGTLANMAPGDVDNRFVDLTNGGTLAASTLTLQGADASETTLDNALDVVGQGLQVSISQCSVAWTVTTGVCSGTTTPVLASIPMHTLLTTPQTLTVSSVAAGAVSHLEFSVTLAGTETSTNGIAPANTIQGQTDTVTYTFNELQRTGVTTNS